MELIKWIGRLAPKRQDVPLVARAKLIAGVLVILAPVDVLASALPSGTGFAAIAVYCAAAIGGVALYLDLRQGNKDWRQWRSVRILVVGCLVAAAVVLLF